MKTLLICGMEGRMGSETARLAPAHGFTPRPFRPGASGAAIIDFSHPDSLEGLLAAGLPLVIGTTGHTQAQQESIRRRSRTLPIFQSANFSMGIYAMTQLACLARRLLPQWELSLTEVHHAGKKDAPSGTALALSEVLSLAPERILSIRAGTVRGIHALGLYGREEHLLLTHTAEGRAAFAHGALQAASWLICHKSGLYGMADLMKPPAGEQG